MIRRQVWREVRFSLYAALVLNGVLIQWVLPIRWRCNTGGGGCFACGLRTAVDLALRGEFAAAWRSNPLIALVAALAARMLAAAALQLRRWYKNRKGDTKYGIL